MATKSTLLPVVVATLLFLSLASTANAFGWSSHFHRPAPALSSPFSQATHTSHGLPIPHPTSSFLLALADDDESSTGTDGGLIDESITQSPSGEIARLKAEMKVATDAGDMDKVMTIMGTLLALEGGYESEAGVGDDGDGGGHSEGFCAD